MKRSFFSGERWLIACAVMLALASARNEAAEAPLASQPSPPASERPLRLLRTPEQIHLLTRDEAERGHRAVIRSVVPCLLPQDRPVVLQDSTRGIYIDGLSHARGLRPRTGAL